MQSFLYYSVAILIVFSSFNSANASIWIKNIKAYGPTAAAHGVQCLSTMTKYYLKEPTLSRTRNLVVSYTQNLSVPADNLQRLYLKWIHRAISSGEVDE